jgi:hypothetical protein
MRKDTLMRFAMGALMATALWACNQDATVAPHATVAPQKSAEFQTSLDGDRARLASLKASIAKDTLHDSLTKAAWVGSVDSLIRELNDIEHDFVQGPVRPEGSPNREKDREAALVARLGTLEQGVTSMPPNTVPKGLLPGPTINLNGKPVGNIAIKVFGGTSTTTQWPPPGASGNLPESLVVTGGKEISMHLKTHSVKDWRFSVFRESAIPILDTTPLVNWTRIGRDSVALGPDDFDSLSTGDSAGGILRFNLRIIMKAGLVEARMNFLTHLTYDKSTRTFSNIDTTVQEDVINFTAMARVSYTRDSTGNPLRTYLYIPGSPYFLDADTSSFKDFPIPYGSFDFRMLALPADWKSDKEALGLIYSVVSDGKPRDSNRIFYPVTLIDSLLLKRTD